MPVEQLEQLDEPEEDWKVPAKQDEQSIAEAAEYLPASQTAVTAVRPVVAQ